MGHKILAILANPLRKLGDSNPRYSYPYGSLANYWFQPLTQTSFRRSSGCYRSVFSQSRCKGTVFFRTVQIFSGLFCEKVRFEPFLQGKCKVSLKILTLHSAMQNEKLPFFFCIALDFLYLCQQVGEVTASRHKKLMTLFCSALDFS